jgi:hypothetical protein
MKQKSSITINEYSCAEKSTESSEPTIIILLLNGYNLCSFCIHRETYLRNPETNECIKMQAHYNASIWPRFKSIAKKEIQEYILIFPALPTHWRNFDFWETKGSRPMYTGPVPRNPYGVYILEAC